MQCVSCAASLFAEAKRLAAKGAQVEEADALDAASLRAAFEGAYGVFAMTPLHGGGGFEDGYKLELEQGARVKNLRSSSTATADRGACRTSRRDLHRHQRASMCKRTRARKYESPRLLSRRGGA